MAQRYVLRMGASQAERYKQLLRDVEPLAAEIALNKWALEQHLENWTKEHDPSDEDALRALSTVVAGHTEQIRKLEETRNKIEQSNRLSWTPRQVQNFIMAVAGVIDLYVRDGDTRTKITGALGAILQNRKYITLPDSADVGAYMGSLYDQALLEDE